MTDLTAIVPGVTGGGGFELDDVRAEGEELALSLRRTSDGGRVELVIGAPDAPRAVWRGERCALRYSTQIGQVTEGEREELRALIEGFGGGTDRWLAANPDATPADLPRSLAPSEERVPFTPDGVLRLLGMSYGAELPGGWRLAGIYPSSMISESESAHMTLVLELRHPSDGALRAELGARNEAARAFARSAHLDLTYLTFGSTPPASAERAMRFLGLMLRLRDTERVEIEHVDATAPSALLLPDASPALLPAETARAAEWLNLAVNSPCEQACEFCSVQELSPPWSGDVGYERLLADLRSNAAAGVRRLRLNGYDPLTHPRVLDLAREARALGYEEVVVFSPCTVLADEAFLDALLAALPDRACFHVPVYGPTAEVHDRVVGRDGAFARVERAMELLRARLPEDRLVITSVAVQGNVEHLLELRRWALERAARFDVKAPYPSSESPTDRFRDAAATFRRIAEETMRAGEAPLVVNGVPPCVYFERSAALAVDPRTWLPDEGHALPGREYASAAFTHRALVVQHGAALPAAVACPHREACALATVCPREVLRSYADEHGLGELAPVSLRSLLGR